MKQGVQEVCRVCVQQVCRGWQAPPIYVLLLYCLSACWASTTDGRLAGRMGGWVGGMCAWSCWHIVALQQKLETGVCMRCKLVSPPMMCANGAAAATSPR